MLYKWNQNNIEYIPVRTNIDRFSGATSRIYVSNSYTIDGYNFVLTNPTMYQYSGHTSYTTTPQYALPYGPTGSQMLSVDTGRFLYNVNYDSGYAVMTVTNDSGDQKLYSSTVSSTAGTFIQNVYSSNSSEYPENGIQNGYWYNNRTSIDTPSAPTTISIPQLLPNTTAQISWDNSIAQVGEVTSYTLQRSINNSEYSTIYTGPNTSYTDNIGDWATVTYKVFATDNYGSNSSVTTSETKVVLSGILYISGPINNMGNKTSPFDFTISVGATGSSLSASSTLIILLDNNKIYDNTVNLNTQITNNIDTRVIGGGNHTIKVNASAENYVPVEEIYNFNTPELILPSGGIGLQLQDNLSRIIFPQTVSSLVGGIYNQSVAKNLQTLIQAVLYTGNNTFTDYFGNIISMPKIEVGNYLGTGVYGDSNPNTLTFDFEPKLLYVSYRSAGRATIGIMSSNPGLSFAESSSSTSIIKTLYSSISDKTISWYSNDSVDMQLNGPSYQYDYVVFG